MLKNLDIGNEKKLICFQVGAANKFKIWPEEKFIELGKKLTEYGGNIIIFILGSKEEKIFCDTIAKKIGENSISLAGLLSLKELGALIELTDLLVTNDTGTMHIAIALKTKTISLFCPTYSWGVGPIQDLHLHKIIQKDRPCNPCLTKKCKNPFCMNLIEVEEVFKITIENLYENTFV